MKPIDKYNVRVETIQGSKKQTRVCSGPQRAECKCLQDCIERNTISYEGNSSTGCMSETQLTTAMQVMKSLVEWSQNSPGETICPRFMRGGQPAEQRHCSFMDIFTPKFTSVGRASGGQYSIIKNLKVRSQ